MPETEGLAVGAVVRKGSLEIEVSVSSVHFSENLPPRCFSPEPSATCCGQPQSGSTKRELQVVLVPGQRKSNYRVAGALGAPLLVVESHRNHIMHDMRFASISELIRFAVQSTLVTP